jgi:hypothetical protein
VFNPLKRILLGTLLPSSQGPRERLTKVTGLAVLSSDALSSVAYATDAMLAVLVPAGLLAVGATRPLTFLIAALLVIVTFSYRQTIHAYLQGGGAYIVAKDKCHDDKRVHRAHTYRECSVPSRTSVRTHPTCSFFIGAVAGPVCKCVHPEKRERAYGGRTSSAEV